MSPKRPSRTGVPSVAPDQRRDFAEEKISRNEGVRCEAVGCVVLSGASKPPRSGRTRDMVGHERAHKAVTVQR